MPMRFGASAEAWALIVSMPLAQAATMSLPVVIAQLREGLALSYSELGVVLASFGVARLVTDLPAGMLVQRFNPRKILLFGLGLTLVAALAGCVANVAWQIGLVRVIHGASSAIVQTAVLAWLVSRATPQGRGRVMALSEALFSTVSVTIPTAVGLLATLLSWRAAFVAGVASTVVATVVVVVWTRSESAAAAMGRSREGPAAGDRSGGWTGLRAGGALASIAFLVTFLVFFSRQGLSTLLPLIGSEQIGMSPFEVGLASSLLSAVSIGAILAGGWLGDRVGRAQLVVPGILAMLAAQLGLFLLGGRASFFTLSAFLGVGFMLSFLPLSLIGDALPAPARPRGIAVYRLVADGAVLLAPLVVGSTVDLGGYDAAKLGVAVQTLLILSAVFWLSPWMALIRARGGRVAARSSPNRRAL